MEIFNMYISTVIKYVSSNDHITVLKAGGFSEHCEIFIKPSSGFSLYCERGE